MTYDYSKLSGKIIEVCGTRANFAELIGLSENSVSCKMNGKVGWSQKQIEKARKVLGINASEISDYFFTVKVQST